MHVRVAAEGIGKEVRAFGQWSRGWLGRQCAHAGGGALASSDRS
jgi:hypothetical protein